MTLEDLLYKIGETAIKNKIINFSAVGGDIYDLNVENIKDYPVLFAAPTGSHEVRQNTTDYEVTFYFLDRLLSDSVNDVQIFSTAIEQLKLILNMVGNIKGVLDVSDDYDIQNFTETERMNDRVAGAFATVNITVQNTSDCCDTEFITLMLKLENKTLNVTKNGKYTVTYNKMYDGLRKVEVDVNVDTETPYNDGFADGKEAGLEEGYVSGKADGIIEGIDQGKELAAADAIVVNADKNGTIYTKFSEDIPEGVQVYDNLIKEVNIQAKINVEENGIRLSNSVFSSIPLVFDFTGITKLDNMFGDCTKLGDLSALENVDVSGVWNMFRCFYQIGINERNLNYLPLANWDTSNVTDMSYMFGKNKTTSLAGLENWNTSNVTDMRNMFETNSNITDMDALANWNTSKVTSMRSMFDGCSKITNADFMENWDTSKADMDRMFYGCSLLERMPAIDCSSVKSDGYPLYNYSNYDNLTDLGGFLNAKLKWTNNYGLVKCPNLTRESCINILNGLYDFTGNSETPSSAQGQLKVHANFITAVGNDISIATNKGWQVSA